MYRLGLGNGHCPIGWIFPHLEQDASLLIVKNLARWLRFHARSAGDKASTFAACSRHHPPADIFFNEVRPREHLARRRPYSHTMTRACFRCCPTGHRVQASRVAISAAAYEKERNNQGNEKSAPDSMRSSHGVIRQSQEVGVLCLVSPIAR